MNARMHARSRQHPRFPALKQGGSQSRPAPSPLQLETLVEFQIARLELVVDLVAQDIKKCRRNGTPVDPVYTRNRHACAARTAKRIKDVCVPVAALLEHAILDIFRRGATNEKEISQPA